MENGPRSKLGEIIETIRGLTAATLGFPLFINPIPETLSFPGAQNTHRYQDAHAELYRYLVDGIDKDCLKSLAARIHASINVDSNKTVENLKKLLPGLNGTSSDFERAYALVSEQRRLASHEVRKPATSFRAFEQFTDDLHLCIAGLERLLSRLEVACECDGEQANRRWRRMLELPKIIKPPADHYAIREASGMSICEATKMVGKTITKVEFGLRESIESVHGTEALIVHFSDGSILGIETGSNSANLAFEHEGLKGEEFHVDFLLHWVPALPDVGSSNSP